MTRRTESAAGALLAHLGSLRPPVDVAAIAAMLGVRVIEESLDSGVSGILFRQDGQPSVIAVNSQHAQVRRRFSIAHELGHLQLHQGRPIIVDHLVRGRVNLRDESSSLATSREEIEANGFAAALLMPADWLAVDLEARLSDTANRAAQTLAERYNVSVQAMEWRLINLGYRSAP